MSLARKISRRVSVLSMVVIMLMSSILIPPNHVPSSWMEQWWHVQYQTYWYREPDTLANDVGQDRLEITPAADQQVALQPVPPMEILKMVMRLFVLGLAVISLFTSAMFYLLR